MTFIDNTSENPGASQIILFSLTSVTFFLCAIHIVRTMLMHSKNRRAAGGLSHYHRIWTVRFLFPLACIFCAVENIALACSGYILRRQLADSLGLQVVFVIQAIQVPIFLLVIFELTYIVHKRRSVHFCGMFFDEGRLGRRVQGVFSTPVKSFVLRNLIRIISLLCLMMGIVANLDLMEDSIENDVLAGRMGWWMLFSRKVNYASDEEGNAGQGKRKYLWTFHILLSLIPTAVLIVCSFFLSIALWRYGSNSSMVVHSSCLNPWFSPMFGTITLSIGQLFSTEWYPFTSNFGFLVYTVTILFLMGEIDKDVVSTTDFTDFLREAAKQGNKISVQNDIAMSGNESEVDLENNGITATSIPTNCHNYTDADGLTDTTTLATGTASSPPNKSSSLRKGESQEDFLK
mmetsp:Transcript_2017/g.2913  ORF Transcript_2017/g.2913 Transcript_2017/m.2913 type:complete len:403 (+) Transcript_2017:247-1455(+)|eukprot:CAMPEP_0194087818 /NCGR_PEP_ID=MMETSP0149-20130528/26629_1 /TAXON_ID=122233 /ORGANISM="Chaetoceros debilis, Strain MM31A-1" /LENGTH=402 /DNA_ID=CAMNT_0038771295 /DNA_START=231 /DNA_END=1439 /DNA_ORIENTATION=+